MVSTQTLDARTFLAPNTFSQTLLATIGTPTHRKIVEAPLASTNESNFVNDLNFTKLYLLSESLPNPDITPAFPTKFSLASSLVGRLI